MFTKESWLKADGYPVGNFLDTWGFGFRQLASGSKMVVMSNSFYFHRWGHDSYWMRESRRTCPSLKALEIMLPFLDLIMDEDVNYIMGEAGRRIWFDKLAERHVRAKAEKAGRSGQIVFPKVSLINRAIRKVVRMARAVVRN
jgi:hypothetical protein